VFERYTLKCHASVLLELVFVLNHFVFRLQVKVCCILWVAYTK